MPILAHLVTAAKQGWALLLAYSDELPAALPEWSYSWLSGSGWKYEVCVSEQRPSSAYCPGKVCVVRWDFVRGSKQQEWRMTQAWGRDLVPSWRIGRARRDSHTHTHTQRSGILIIVMYFVPWTTRSTRVSHSSIFTDPDKLRYVCAFGWQDLCSIIFFNILFVLKNQVQLFSFFLINFFFTMLYWFLPYTIASQP